MKLRLSCREASRLLSERLDTSLLAGDRARLRLHVAICEACRGVDQQFDVIRRAMRKLSDDPPDAPPPEPPAR